ncbi:MAG: leucine-rich repeat-containing protein kinase family protein [Burkholderiaceae bacterium]
MTDPRHTLADLRAGRLAGATSLDLRHCGLAEFPREVFGLAATLTLLDLSGNALESLPDDFDRLHALRTLFCSNNRFATLPPVLGRCARLDLIGFKANVIEHVPGDALPERLRWLILTDNRIVAMPEALGRCAPLRKLALAGNRLTALPAGIARCDRLELLRISANRFAGIEDALPAGLLALPRLAWLAFAGNPFNSAQEAQAIRAAPIARIPWESLEIGERLGEGASGFIHSARRRAADGAEARLAVKLFKGDVTSDGLPDSEMAACIAAGLHEHLIGVEGRIDGHPRGVQGLVMRLIPAHYRNLAGPPSLDSCTRDVYAPGLRLGADQARRIARGAGAALAHLHARGLVHGDFYAHNLLVDERRHALLGDFGAASFLPADDAGRSAALKRIDRRALAVLVDELAQRCDDASALADLRP